MLVLGTEPEPLQEVFLPAEPFLLPPLPFLRTFPSLGEEPLITMLFLSGMDVYGYLLAREGRLEDVENLGCRLFNISDQHAEPWVVSGYAGLFLLFFSPIFSRFLKKNTFFLFKRI